MSGTTTPQDRLPVAEEAFAERLAPLIWPAVPLSGLDRDDPRRLAAEIVEELLRARGHLVAAVERVRNAAALRRRMLELDEPDGEPGS